MSENLLRKRLFLASLVLMVLILSITAWMNINSFEEQFVEAQTVSFAVKGSDFINTTQYALRYGKELDNFYGMNALLSDWKDTYPEIDDARIIMKNHQAVYSYSGVLDNLAIDPLIQANSFKREKITYQSAFVEGVHYVYLPILAQDNEVVGSLELSFLDTYIKEQMAPFLSELLKWIGGLILFSAIALGIFSYKGKIVDKEGILHEKLVILGVLLIMGLVQIVYGVYNYRLFDEAYTSLSKMNATVAMEGIERDFDSIIDHGVNYDEISETGAYLTSLSQQVPQIEGVVFERLGGEYDSSISDKGEIILDEVEKRYKVVTNLHPDSQGHEGRVTVVIDKDYIQSGLREIMLDSLTIFATAFFFMVEIVLFLMLYMSSHTTSKDADVVFEDESYNGGNLRILAFIIYTACYMPVSFVPKVMKSLYQPIEGVDVNFVLGLPVSIVFFGGAIFTLVGGKWIDRIGWRRVLEIGLVTLIASAVLSGMVFSGWIFVLARGIYGVGYALIYISMRSFAASMKGDLAKRKGFSAITSGVYAGVNTGAVFGAILLDKLGFRSVFFISGGLILMSFALLLMFFPKGRASEQEKMVKDQSKGGIGHFLRNRQVWLFFLLVNVPMAMTVIFLDYFYPVYADGVGIATSTIGRAYLLNGICVAYLSPLIIKSIGSKFSSRQTLIFALGMMVVSMGLFSYYGTLSMMLISAGILGIGEGVGLASQTEYYLSLEAVKGIGRGEALGYYSNARKIAQMFGPQLFAYAIGFGYTEGIGYLGIGIACMLLIFVISGFSHIKGVKASS